MVPGVVGARDAVAAGEATTLRGSPLTFDIVDGRLRVAGAGVTGNDLRARNGVVHVIDTVLMPAQ